MSERLGIINNTYLKVIAAGGALLSLQSGGETVRFLIEQDYKKAISWGVQGVLELSVSTVLYRLSTRNQNLLNSTSAAQLQEQAVELQTSQAFSLEATEQNQLP